MLQTKTLEEKNLKAEIFSAPVVADELARMWSEKRAAIRQVAKEIYRAQAEKHCVHRERRLRGGAIQRLLGRTCIT